ncbi:polyadenylate-binding protein [Elysia marginata]|uniref:Polyadenylate-binding protein n=1 Tax=Elysia marginata TaxID=1093978 RepID=A0AAV4EWV5_9GAST|nr:polyadenylate-binding protein [Elysia marginata]
MTSTTSTTQDIPSTLASMSAASLFVGELLPHVNEVILYKKFAPMGTVTSVKLCRDWVTGNSLCYAYVNFENPAEAEKAYRTLNYELLEGQPMRIMKSTRNPWVPKGGDCSCFHHHHHCCAGVGVGVGMGVGANKGLVDAKTLMEAIESYSMAFKTLASQDSGESKTPTGYKYSKEFLKRMNTNNSHFTNVFIKNFKDLLDDFKLWKLCKQFGEVISAKVMVDEYGISKGFGFACFTDSDAAQRAVNKLNGLVLDGRTLYAGPAMTRTQRQRDFRHYDNEPHRYEWRSPHSSTSNTGGGSSATGNSFFYGNGNMGLVSCSPRICVRNLRDLVDDIRLRKEFERFGPVLHAELLKNFDGTSKGVGYVIYKDQTDASKALNSMHGKVIYGTRISVNYAPYTNTTATNTISDINMVNNDDMSNSNDANNAGATADDTANSANDDIISTNIGNSSGNSGSKGINGNNTSNDGDNNGSGSGSSKNLLKFKDLVTSLANKGHPVNINDISSGFNSTSVNRNSSNNSDNINTSNNAILALTAARKAATTGDAATGKRSTYAQTMPISSSTSPCTTSASNFKYSGIGSNNSSGNNTDYETVKNELKNAGNNNDDNDGNDDDEIKDDGSSTANRPRRGGAEPGSDDCDDVTSTTATLSVKNLDESITDEKLESLFSVYGQVVSAKVISNEFGASKGFGFVIMAEAQDAVRAIKNLDGRIVVNRPVYVAPTGQPRTLTRA